MEIKKKTYRKTRGNATHDLILSKANEIITELGMSELRIDSLSTSLGFSPGNITYHFHKKDDIATALWELVKENVEMAYTRHISSILDIKQLYLFIRSLAIENKSYIGVIAYKLGDKSLISTLCSEQDKAIVIIREKYNEIIKFLVSNDYINQGELSKSEEETFKSVINLMFWWIIANSNRDSSSDLDLFAFSTLYPLTPFFTAEGTKQYNKLISHMLKKTKNDKSSRTKK